VKTLEYSLEFLSLPGFIVTREWAIGAPFDPQRKESNPPALPSPSRLSARPGNVSSQNRNTAHPAAAIHPNPLNARQVQSLAFHSGTFTPALPVNVMQTSGEPQVDQTGISCCANVDHLLIFVDLQTVRNPDVVAPPTGKRPAATPPGHPKKRENHMQPYARPVTGPQSSGLKARSSKFEIRRKSPSSKLKGTHPEGRATPSKTGSHQGFCPDSRFRASDLHASFELRTSIFGLCPSF
jgi:hypothetical protein